MPISRILIAQSLVHYSNVVLELPAIIRRECRAARDREEILQYVLRDSLRRGLRECVMLDTTYCHQWAQFLDMIKLIWQLDAREHEEDSLRRGCARQNNSERPRIEGLRIVCSGHRLTPVQ